MKTHGASLLRIAAVAALLAHSTTAHAVLLDHGPGDPVLVFPQWYRDLNGLALHECLSTTPSPNPGAGLKPFCFVGAPDPNGFAGNVGPEIFYNDLNTSLSGPKFSLRYIAALEATYLPAGVPVHGTEVVFGRIRIVMNPSVPGVYKVTHPYGVEVFNVSQFDLGARGIFFTADVPLGPPLDFEGALQSRIGPFIQWDFVDPGLTLTVTNAAGQTESFVGDPGYNHTYTGSPFGTNYVRVDGPPGSNISGIGDDFIQTPLGFILGQVHTAAIPTTTVIQRATYSRDPVKNVIGIDVYAKSLPAQQLFLTGSGMPSAQMAGDAVGNYFVHVEMPATAVPPASIAVTNASSNPQITVSTALIDLVNITTASFDTLTRALKVTATSSDLLAPGPALAVDGPLGGPMVAGSYTTTLAAGVLPPRKISVQSSAGGIDTDDVVILPGLTDAKPFPPVAIPDALTLNMNTSANIDLSANDAITPPALVSQVVIVSPPLNGTAAPIGINTGVVTYTPARGFFGADSFSYVLVDTAGAVSNVTTVAVTVNFVALGPTANNDDFALVQNTSRTYNVLANDVASAGTTINAASVAITTRPLHGNVVANANGTITYAPLLNYRGGDSFQYTVANSAGVASNVATVNIVVEGGTEVVSIGKATYTSAKTTWTIVGSTNWFGPTLVSTKVTCWVGKGIAVGPLIGTAPVDTFGKFQLVAGPNATPPDATNIFTCQSSNGGFVSAAVTVQ